MQHSAAPPVPIDGRPLREAVGASVTPVAGSAASPPEVTEPLLDPATAGLTLEQRVRRLEEGLAQLQEARRDGSSPMGEATMPAENSAAAVPSSELGMLLDAGRRLFGRDHAGHATVAPTELVVPPRMLPFEIWAEARAIVRMFLDPRYRLTWTCRLVPAILVFLIFFSHWWFPPSWFAILGIGIGTYIDKVLDLVLAYLLFKVVSREARRYRQTSPDLPPSLRL